MSIKKKILVCITVFISFAAAVISSAVYGAMLYFERYGKPKIQDYYLDNILTSFLIALIIVFILMLIAMFIIGGMLIKSVIAPLNELYRLANEIKNGNLDCGTDYYKKDEFGKVFDEFDEMRLRLKNSLEQLTEHETARKEMVINIAHDIKTPVTAICGHAEGLIDGIANTPEKQEKYLRTILEKSKIVDQLVSDLFLFSKLDLNQMPFELRPVKAADYLRNTYNEIIAGQNDIFIEFETDIDNETKINIDAFQFKRVLQNINQNSIKYSNDDKTYIHLSVRENIESVIIKISDRGVGVSEDDCDKLFDRFFRTDRARSAKGSGLGLSISKQIIEAMNGKIWAKRNDPKGLSIYISLPKETSC